MSPHAGSIFGPLEYLHPLSFLDLREFRDLSKRGEKEKAYLLSFFLSVARFESWFD